MSEQNSGAIFCCCRRSRTKSSVNYAHNLESRLKLKEEEGRDDAAITSTFPPKDASKSMDEAEMWMNCSFSSDEKSLDTQQLAEADTLVLPSRIKSSLPVESETERFQENASDALRSSDDLPSLEYLVNFEKYIERLEAVADLLENENCAKDVTHDVATLGFGMERKNSDVPAFYHDPPSIILTNGQWNVANHSGNKDLVLRITDTVESVNVSDCNECAIQIEGKPGAITISNCAKCGVVIQEASKPLTITDSQRLQIQVLGAVPSIDARNTDGLSIYLSRESQQLPVFGFKCSELNLLIPLDGGDFKEISIPEQFQSHWNGDRLVTNVANIMN